MAKTKKILFLFPYPHGTAASQRFRFEQYLDILKAQGYQLQLQCFLDETTWAILYKPGRTLAKAWGLGRGFLRRLKVFFTAGQYAYIFIHREASPLGLPWLEWSLAKLWRKKIIFDFDDAIWLPNTSDSNSLAAWFKFHQKTAWICRWAYKVSAGNNYLAEYARKYNPQVVLNPTTIDTLHWHNRTRDQSLSENLVIGWTGTHSTLKYLDELVPILKKLEQQHTFTFLVIADRAPAFILSSLKFVPWQKHTEIEDLLRMHVGVMPLTDDAWAKGKCGFKALQYMALGIPPLVSPVGVNLEIVQNNENGFICDTPQNWEAALLSLLTQAALRQKMGEAARRTVEARYSVMSNQNNFVELFS
ncbi:MAG: glycosyltransferase family 4 protein [Microscillaceae bacterium]|nr:glycosyltransferase family 4 protein [Microscillaceae bacterium]